MMWKTRNLTLLTGILLLVISPLIFGAKKPTTGTIKGQVNYCSQGGYVAMQVFIPGRQFMVFLGQDGRFMLENVPAGTFNLNYVINGKLVHESYNVLVQGGGISDLGEVAFCDKGGAAASTAQPPTSAEEIMSKCIQSPELAECQDADKDGVIAVKDCNDNSASVYPGAVELCDNIDNNCNGKIDEVQNVEIPNGIGSCNPGGVVSVKSCNKKFADCDKDPSNGCEIDIYNDNENCGKCFNQCAPLEICKLGIC
ncbi:MAG: putative metal-binding motif-containing protein [Gammaproteobacteria bacterium]|nr:putative metal-binding motif-containing protein [Gammaproteobacteria bacterium]